MTRFNARGDYYIDCPDGSTVLLLNSLSAEQAIAKAKEFNGRLRITHGFPCNNSDMASNCSVLGDFRQNLTPGETPDERKSRSG